jgi:hypothetical protein
LQAGRRRLIAWLSQGAARDKINKSGHSSMSFTLCNFAVVLPKFDYFESGERLFQHR